MKITHEAYAWCLETAIARFQNTLTKEQFTVLEQLQFPFAYAEEELDKLGFHWAKNNPEGIRYGEIHKSIDTINSDIEKIKRSLRYHGVFIEYTQCVLNEEDEQGREIAWQLLWQKPEDAKDCNIYLRSVKIADYDDEDDELFMRPFELCTLDKRIKFARFLPQFLLGFTKYLRDYRIEIEDAVKKVDAELESLENK